MEALPRITVQMEGLPEENGHVRLNDFLAWLEDLKKMLSQFGQMESGKYRSDIYYRVVNLSHSSPATVELEPVRRAPKPVKKRKNNTTPPARNPSNPPLRVWKELTAISKKAEVSEDVDPETLSVMKSLVPSSSNGIASASINFGDSTVMLDQQFSKNLNTLIEGEEHSIGSIEGHMEALNIHGPRYSCCIYPAIGPYKIRCYFGISKRAAIIAAIGKCVRITGKKHYRRNSDFPYLIELMDLEVLETGNSVKLSSLEGALKNSTMELSPSDFSDEW